MTAPLPSMVMSLAIWGRALGPYQLKRVGTASPVRLEAVNE